MRISRTTFGSLRRADCREAEIVLSSGVYLVFRLDVGKTVRVQNVIEVNRTRKGAQPRESILVDARVLQAARRTAMFAIATHRERMGSLPPIEKRYAKPHQLRLALPPPQR